MELDTRSFGGDWANDAFVALNTTDPQPAEKWAAFIPPALLTHGSVSRYGQVTPPEELSPAEPPLDGNTREHSIPLEELKDEALFPDHQIQALQNFQPRAQQEQKDGQEQDEQDEQEQERPSKRRRTSRQPVPANRTTTQPQQDNAQPTPPKRKRGRPKSQPQMVEAFTADGFPFQVSSARQSHLEKNRVAAHKCRQRKKEYIGGLEGRARQFTAKNKALKENVAMLREELLGLKNEVLRHAGCGFWAVDEYLTQCAGDLLGMQVPGLQQQQQQQRRSLASNTQTQSEMQSPTMQLDTSPTIATLEPEKLYRESREDSLPSLVTTDSPDMDDYAGFDLLEDLDEDNEVSNAA